MNPTSAVQASSVGVPTDTSRILRPRPWLRATIIFAASIFLLGAVSSHLRSGWTWISIAYVVISVIGLGGVLEIAVTRIVLSEAALESHSLFYRRSYRAADIASVTWEAGVGVSVELAGGGWARIPEMGYNAQGLANTLRAWLKRASHRPRHDAAQQQDAADKRRALWRGSDG